MECPLEHRDQADILLSYCSGRLDGERQANLERHFEACPECRKLRDTQAAVWSALEEWKPEPVSADFNRRLYARISLGAAAPWWKRLFHPTGGADWRPAFSLATASLVLVAVLLVNTPGAPPAPPRPKVDSVDVEQVERSLDDMEMLRQLTPVAKAEAPEAGEKL